MGPLPYSIGQSFWQGGQNKSVRKFPEGSFRTLFCQSRLGIKQAAVFEYSIAG